MGAKVRKIQTHNLYSAVTIYGAIPQLYKLSHWMNFVNFVVSLPPI